MANEYIDYILDIKTGMHTETHTISIHLFNDWTQKANIVRENVCYEIPASASVYARYNKATNDTEIRFTWYTITKDII